MTDHDHDDYYDDDGLTLEERLAIAKMIAEQDTLELLTVGIDIGSSTSHLLFARILLRRQVHELSTRFVVVDRSIEWRSPILLTPFVPNGTIDADELRAFFDQCYKDAGFKKDDIDSGAVILTGEAIKQSNARAIDEIFASESGKFVCATAGHRLESTLAAHGSGATALSKQEQAVGLHADVGGGTTKLALIDKGEIVSVSAFAVGGRLLAKDDAGAWTRVNDPAVLVAQDLGVPTSPEALADDAIREQIIERFATLLCDQVLGGPTDELGRSLELTEALDRTLTPEYLTLSGGVAEYMFGHETADHGDIARELASTVLDQLGRRTEMAILESGQRIRATVIGASQFTVQVSGKTIYLSNADTLPVQNVPVIRLSLPLSGEIEPDTVADALLENIKQHDRHPQEMLAIAFEWSGPPTYDRLAAMAKAITTVVSDEKGDQGDALLVLAIEGDIGQSLGRILCNDFGLQRGLISADGIELKDLDFIDIGSLMNPPGVLPIVIKSLVFS